MTNKEIIEEYFDYGDYHVIGSDCIYPLLDLARADEGNYKAKYEKAINVIRRFDAGIIGMYDL